ncbi:uncharacterized protein MCYG_08011 [Microsporum canis CBS 113480]|uniref:Uncharacterized protein n=1 Tax=Arthroderma otae (strain ATCC MYA-4605 / CBS 113480) TaxID=554155 RepID=C5FZ89_ARTOC|nr:uncharacterized protein MCYG_08011 [Microsporum canis CBS 113480]EEQ35192.1 predicted protein [Microsporum canis CBS 113480]
MGAPRRLTRHGKVTQRAVVILKVGWGYGTFDMNAQPRPCQNLLIGIQIRGQKFAVSLWLYSGFLGTHRNNQISRPDGFWHLSGRTGQADKAQEPDTACKANHQWMSLYYNSAGCIFIIDLGPCGVPVSKQDTDKVMVLVQEADQPVFPLDYTARLDERSFGRP